MAAGLFGVVASQFAICRLHFHTTITVKHESRGFGNSERGIKIAKKIQRLDPRKRVALLIGNGAYKTARLRNPVNDAS